jgi:hypothetical protein
MVAVVAVALLAHGLVHLAVWAARPDPAKPPPFDPAHSWVLSGAKVDAAAQRATSVRLATLVAGTFTLASGLLLAGSGAWAGTAVLAAAAGLALKVGWFDRWLSAGVLTVILAALAGWPS